MTTEMLDPIRDLFRRLSPWHRGYDRGYADALKAVKGGLKVSVDLATAYAEQELRDAAKKLAEALR